MIEKRDFRAQLRPFSLSKDVDSDYIAEVSTSKFTLKHDDIARRIVADGSEYKRGSLVSIFDRYDEEVLRALSEGYSVMSGNIQLTPTIQGLFAGDTAKFDPSEHKVTCTVILTKAMREAMKKIHVNIIGVKGHGASIGLVTNTTTREIDGQIEEGNILILDGKKIKVTPDDDPACGVFFVPENGNEIRVTHHLTLNDPTRIICSVPRVISGTNYRLQVRTRFSSGGTLLKEMRTIEYGRILTAAGGGL